MEPLQFQSIFKIVMVTQSIPGLVGLIRLISPRLDWLLIRCWYINTLISYLTFHFALCFPGISFRLNRLISNNPFGFHLINMFLHILNCNLAFVVLKNYTKRKKIAFIASIIFSCHPIHTVRNVKKDLTICLLVYACT